MIKSSHFTIVTNNLEKSISFYRDILKINLIKYEKDLIAIFKVLHGQFQIFQENSTQDSHHLALHEQKGTVIIGFEIEEEMEKMKEYLISQNVKIESEIIDDKVNKMKMLFIEDHDGNEVCLTKMEFSPLS